MVCIYAFLLLFSLLHSIICSHSHERQSTPFWYIKLTINFKFLGREFGSIRLNYFDNVLTKNKMSTFISVLSVFIVRRFVHGKSCSDMF